MANPKKPVGLGDIVLAVFAPLPTIAEEDEPSGTPVASAPEVRQITPPTAEDMKEIQGLADRAAELHDEIEDLVGIKLAELATKKTALREKLLNHGLKEVAVAGRPPVVLATKREKETTKKAITAALGAEETAKLWKNLPVKTSHYVSIPPRTPPG